MYLWHLIFCCEFRYLIPWCPQNRACYTCYKYTVQQVTKKQLATSSRQHSYYFVTNQQSLNQALFESYLSLQIDICSLQHQFPYAIYVAIVRCYHQSCCAKLGVRKNKSVPSTDTYSNESACLRETASLPKSWRGLMMPYCPKISATSTKKEWVLFLNSFCFSFKLENPKVLCIISRRITSDTGAEWLSWVT